MNTISLKKPFASKEKPPSFGIPINVRWSVITPDAFTLLIKQLSGALQIHRTHFHHFIPSRLPPPQKTSKATVDKGKTPCEENSHPPKKQTIRE
jgi:hypothetical protein